MPVISFNHIDVIFGPRPQTAIAMLDQGEDRDAIYGTTGNLVAVHDASLFVEKGEILVLMGLSGSGKSTLLRCVNGLNTISRGHLSVETGGRVVHLTSCDQATLQDFRRNGVSMVFQQFGLMPWLSVRDNVGFGLDVRGVHRDERQRIVDEKLGLVRLEQWADKLPHELSGGMQQRVGLARALASEADILLMDEPFSALDPLIREHLQGELLELQRRLHKTIVFVSHDLNEAMRIGSRIAIMHGGKVVQFGRPADIVLSPANDYVRQFVASMNPMAVLNGAMLMSPLAECERDSLGLVMENDWRCQLDAQGRPELCHHGGKTYAPITVTTSERMREIVSHYQEKAQPLVVCDDEGKALGVIAAKELHRGLLRSGAV